MPALQVRGVTFLVAGLAVFLAIVARSYDLVHAIKSHLASVQLPPSNPISKMASRAPKTPVYFLSHGGVRSQPRRMRHGLTEQPNIMEEPEHPAYKSLQEIGREITTGLNPKAVVVFSAHWQGKSDKIQVNTAEITDLIYDFYGFPDWYYSVKYPHVGSRDLAQNIMSKLENAGIAYEPVQRGLDHGAWVPLLIAFNPEKNPLTVPIVQVSLFKNENPDEHYRLGEAIAALREENILVLASGMAVHNLRDLWNSMTQDQPMPYVVSFDNALQKAATTEPSQRKLRMAELLKRGDARQAHPSFDHLLPIHIAAGAAGSDVGKRLFTMAEGSMSWAQYRFGDITANETLTARL